MSKKGLNNVMKGVNDANRTVGSVSRLTRSIGQTGKKLMNLVGGKKNKKDKDTNNKDDNSWLCECGKSNTEKFCGNCGKQAPQAVICPICDWERIPENSQMKFCGNCGARFDE